jgi:hypothetical protein
MDRASTEWFGSRGLRTLSWTDICFQVINLLALVVDGTRNTLFIFLHLPLRHSVQHTSSCQSLATFHSPCARCPCSFSLPGYKFTQDDYFAYEQERAALLRDPRIARAALLRGGIVWRLAVATLSFDDVLDGPTTAATLRRQGVVLKTSDASVDLCDDGLSKLELDIICGLHHCLTGLFFLLSRCLLTIISYP